MFGNAPRALWSRWMAPDDQNRIPLACRCLLVQEEGRNVLLEAGIGAFFEPAMRARFGVVEDGHVLLDSLARAGLAPEDIDVVVLSHLHFDHAGGLTRLPRPGSGESTDPRTPPLSFPNARVITQRLEWEDAKANRSTMHATYLPDHLTPEVGERLTLVDGAPPPLDDRGGLPARDAWFSFTPVAPGIEVFRVPGHTPGQQAVKIDAAGGRTLVYVPDVMPTAWHASPTANMAYDMEPYVSMLQRGALLDLAATNHWLLCLDHEPGEHAVFEVEADREKPGRHRLVPAG